VRVLELASMIVCEGLRALELVCVRARGCVPVSV
jgi:hypothetical protein